MDDLFTKLSLRCANVGIVGLGYVGLPLALAFADKGVSVVGFDVDAMKVDAINEGRSYIKHIEPEEIGNAVSLGRLEATSDFTQISRVDALIICVPTPLGIHLEPDLSFVESTIASAVPHLRPQQIISLESTTYPGTTEEILRPKLEAAGFTIGEDCYLVYSPEREDPGNPQFSGRTIPKVVGGSTETCRKMGEALYGIAFEQVVPVSSTKIAEFSKLLENIYRAVNIGLVNELKVAADKMGIDIWEVIQASSTKPFGFKPFYPGPGLGGHCIPIDPFYLTWKAREYGVHTKFIELAGQINREMPHYVVSRTAEALNGQGKPVKGSRVLLLGLAYKEDVDDLRESPTFALMDSLSDLGAVVDYHDPYIPEIGPTREHMQWSGKKSEPLTLDTLRQTDCVIISTAHASVDYDAIVANASLIVDTRNAIERYCGRATRQHVVKA
jgi:UDP-N-acetyl-D-glucosamine dehydrogenase